MDKQVSEIIEKYYDIGMVCKVTEIFGGFNNRGFCIHTRKDRLNHTYFVCQYKEGMTRQEIQFEHTLISHAIAKGLTICAGLVPTENGKTLVKPANSNKMFSVFEYLRGEDKYTWTDTHLTDTEFRNAASVLAEFHHAVWDFNPEQLKRREPPIAEFLPIIVKKLMSLGQKMKAGEFQSYFRANLNDILGAIARHAAVPNEVNNLPVIPAHYDFHPGNLKWEGEAVTGLFDFDWSKMDLRLFDVCMATIYFCSRWNGRRDGELRLGKAALFLESYQNRLKGLKDLTPLSEQEQRLLPKMLVIANIYLLYWEVSKFCGSKEAIDKEYLVYLKHNVRLMSWLETHRSAISDAVAMAIK